jgi:TRAP-type mannitol/chloroaromatic compound transport system substrate-binding protein
MIPALAVSESWPGRQIEAGYSRMGCERGQVVASALFGATPFDLGPHGHAAWISKSGGNG